MQPAEIDTTEIKKKYSSNRFVLNVLYVKFAFYECCFSVDGHDSELKFPYLCFVIKNCNIEILHK